MHVTTLPLGLELRILQQADYFLELKFNVNWGELKAMAAPPRSVL